MSRCFAGYLVQALNRCGNHLCGLRNYASDVWPIDALTVGVESLSKTLTPRVVLCTAGLKYPPFDSGRSSLVRRVKYLTFKHRIFDVINNIRR